MAAMFRECVAKSAAWVSAGRGMTLSPDGTLLVSNFDSGQVETVEAAARRRHRPVSCSDSSRSWRRASRS
jgi:hypothetical protein